MSRLWAAVGSAIGAGVGALSGVGLNAVIDVGTDDHLTPKEETWVLASMAILGAAIGASIGAGSGCVVVAKSVGTSGECTPLVSDPGLPFHLPSHPRFP